MRARIVIVNWRQPELTLRAARSVREQLRAGDRLVLVDNGSGDGSAALLRDRGYDVVEVAGNRGFGAGVNAGARGMDEDALVLLNNDAVADPCFLEEILSPLEDVEGGAVGATTARIQLSGRWVAADRDRRDALVAHDGARWVRAEDDGGVLLLNSTGNQVDASGNGSDRDWLAPVDGPTAPAEVFGFCGGACAIRRDAWEQVGPFREDLFMYYEDTEMSWRLREAGWDIRYVEGARTTHDHAASSGTTSPMFLTVNARNRIAVALLHGPAGMCVRALGRTMARVVRGPNRGPVARGLAQAVGRAPGLLAARWRARGARAGTAPGSWAEVQRWRPIWRRIRPRARR